MSAEQVEEKSPPHVVRGERQDDDKADQRSKPDVRGSDAAANGDAAALADEQAKQKRRPVVFIIGGGVLALLAIGGLYYWLTTRNIESTDDAYTDGRAITIAPQVSGVVVSLDVTDNQFVKQGQPLIHIDPRQYQIDREQAEGALATAKAQYRGQQFGLEIAQKNFPAQLEQAKAQLENAQASMPIRTSIWKGMSIASSSARDQSSRHFRRKMPQAISSRSCSGYRSRS